MNAEYVVVFITTGDAGEARRIGNLLLELRQAACFNVIRGVGSWFWWREKIDLTTENLLIVKTRASLLPDVIQTVKKAHSYAVPEIIALPIIGGNQDYLDWIGKETAPGGDQRDADER
jgi:periplasmic divalent cation tolerance protein